MWGIIATWRMAKDGVEIASELLKNSEKATSAIIKAINDVENNRDYFSVGDGGLPNEKMEVELDAGFMNGDNLSVGAVGALCGYPNPINIAYDLSLNDTNCFLVGQGAEEYAESKGYKKKDLLSEKSKAKYREALNNRGDLTAYRGHDTVGMVCLDNSGSMVSACSTSGLFMKKKGRVGDSPVVGSGYYADSDVGGASATGVGEEIMKGVLSYEVVLLMKAGNTPQEACDIALNSLDEKLKKKRGKALDMSVIAMDKKGNFGAATNIKDFAFVVATENLEPIVYRIIDNKIVKAEERWINSPESIV